jgi:hypothetical protein
VCVSASWRARCFIPAHFREEYDRNCPSLKKREGSYRRARNSSAEIEEEDMTPLTTTSSDAAQAAASVDQQPPVAEVRTSPKQRASAASVDQQPPGVKQTPVAASLGEYHTSAKGESVGEYHYPTPDDGSNDVDVVMNPTMGEPLADGADEVFTHSTASSAGGDVESVAPVPRPRGGAPVAVGAWSDADSDPSALDPDVYVNHVPRHQQQSPQAAHVPTVYKNHVPGQSAPPPAAAPASPPPLPTPAPEEPVIGQPEQGCVKAYLPAGA